MKKRIVVIAVIISFAAMIILALQIKTYREKLASKPSYVERIQKMAETMEVFPVDLIAREGPLSYFRKGPRLPKISIRWELNREAFDQFYDFCQLAFDATPKDINKCIKYLPEASAKEKSLILTVFYIYIYPWEKQKQVTSQYDYIEAIKTRSWLSLQYPTGAFDLTIREKFQSDHVKSSKRLLPIITQYLNNDEIVFQTISIEEGDSTKDDSISREDRIEAEDLLWSLKIDDVQNTLSLFFFKSRKKVVDEIRRKYPNDASKKISNVLYVTYWQDMSHEYSGGSLRGGNTSENPKTLGQIAQELLASWDVDTTRKLMSKHSYVERIQKTAETMEIFPIDFIAREGPLSNFGKNAWYSKITVRWDLNREVFEQFYDFCQLAFDATPKDISACIDYLPKASAKEKSLILTVFYIYIYPWEKQKRIMDRDTLREASETQSWLAIRYPTNVFDLTIREKFQSDHVKSSERLLPIIAQYVNNVEIAFQSYEIDPQYAYIDRQEAIKFLQTLKTKDGKTDDNFLRFSDILNNRDILDRENILNEVREKYPADVVSSAVSCYLYVSYLPDMFSDFHSMSGIGPNTGNTSEKPKTLGQIAQELLESWEVGTKLVPKPSYVERIQKMAETMKIFPIDLIARDGPLSYFEKGSSYPKISIRQEMNREAFERFYNFCQLAFDATPRDIRACTNYLPKASVKEKSLILTILYIYIYPWEKQKRITDIPEHLEALKTQSWLAIQYPTGAFDLTIREIFPFDHVNSSKYLLPIIAQYANNEEIAFRSYKIDPQDANFSEIEKNRRETTEFLQTLKIKAEDTDDNFPRFLDIYNRENILNEVREKYPADVVSSVVSCYLYASYWSDLFPDSLSSSGISPKAGNTSEKPKTLGQIARELLDSYDGNTTGE